MHNGPTQYQIFFFTSIYYFTESLSRGGRGRLNGCFESLEDILTTTREAPLSSLPVDDFPNVFNIRRLAVEVLQQTPLVPVFIYTYTDVFV